MSIILNIVVDPSSGDAYDIVTVENIAEGYIVHIRPLSFTTQDFLPLEGTKFLYYGAQTSVALTSGVQALIDDGKLAIV